MRVYILRYVDAFVEIGRRRDLFIAAFEESDAGEEVCGERIYFVYRFA